MNGLGPWPDKRTASPGERSQTRTASAFAQCKEDAPGVQSAPARTAQFDAWRIVASTLHSLGTRHVFGIPGTQNTAFYEALRHTSINTVVPTSELAAAFMAGAYHRACGRPGILTTIQGPGLAYTLAGLAEARLDSAALVYLLEAPARQARHGYDLQCIDQNALLGPVTKAIVTVSAGQDIEAAVRECWRAALAGEPGPVALELDLAPDRASVPTPSGDSHAARDYCALRSSRATSVAAAMPTAPSIAAAWRRIALSEKPVVVAGQGALTAHCDVRDLCERLQAPLLTTPSARGIIPETALHAMGFDVLKNDSKAANSLLDEADVVIVLGAKLGHNGSAGFEFQIAAEKLVRVDTSPEALTAVYPADQALEMDVGAFLAAGRDHHDSKSTWQQDALAAHRAAIRTVAPIREPNIAGAPPANFMPALRRALPANACVVTDTGLHQVMTRRHLDISSPRGLLMPSDFQSMGFGLPAAIGARLADASRPVIAIVGDGSFRMNGFELATAIRDKIALTVLVFNDSSLNQIRQQQLSEYGVTSGTELGPIAFDAFAEAVGAGYARVASLDELTPAISRGLGSDGVTLIDVAVGDTVAMRSKAIRTRSKHLLRRMLGDRVVGQLKAIKHGLTGN